MAHSHPTRPSVPALAWCAAGMWCGAVIAEELSWRVLSVGAWPGTVWCAVAAAAGLAVAAAALRSRATSAWLACLLLGGCALGLAVGGMSWARWRADAAALGAASPAEWVGVVVEDPASGLSGLLVTVRLEGRADPPGVVARDAPGVGAVVSLRWPKSAQEPAFGMRVAFKSRFSRVDPTKPGARDSERAGECADGSVWAVTGSEWPAGPAGAVARWRAGCASRIGRIGGPGGDLLASTLLGDRRRIAGTPAEDALRASGAAHLVAASGLHLGLACLLVAWAVRVVGGHRRSQALGVLVAGCSFAVATGLRIAVVRALLLVAAVWLASLAGRRRDPIAALAAAAIVLVGLEPEAVFEAGLQLGVMAVASVVVFGPLATAWFAAALPDAWRRVAGGLGAVASLQAGTLPLASAMFGMLSTAGPVTLVAAVPLVESALVSGLVGGVLAPVWPQAGQALLTLGSGAASLAVRIATAVASLPGSAFPVDAMPAWAVAAWAAVLIALWATWPQPRRRWRVRLAAGCAAVCLLLVVLGPPLRPGSAIVVMDVGQGDAILVRDGETAMLVDSGPDPTSLRRALARCGVRDISCVVLTHAHADHTGGLKGLVGVARVGWVGGPDLEDPAPLDGAKATAASLARDEWTPLHAGMSWQVGATSIRVLWPPERAPSDLPANDTSVILAVERGGQAALLLGDAEERAQVGAIEKGGAAAAGPFAIMKVAHHGSVNGVVPSTLAIWQPAVALVSVGAGNRFGHPHAAAMQALASARTQVWRTDLNGDITVRTDAAGWQVSASGGPAEEPASAPAAAAPAVMPARDGRAAIEPVSCATMDGTWRALGRCAPACFPGSRAEHDGSQRSGRSQARLPDPRLRGAAAGARGPPSARPVGEGRRPRLQPGYVRR